MTADAPEAVEVSSWLRAAAEGDREVMEKGSRAFVSLVRGYKEHHCKFVFRLQVSGCVLRGLPLIRFKGGSVVGCGAALRANQHMHTAQTTSNPLPFTAMLTLHIPTFPVHCAQELPLGPLAQSMGLLRLPRMPELKKGSAANALEAFVASPVEPDSVKFKDKTREKQRQQVGIGQVGGCVTTQRCLAVSAVAAFVAYGAGTGDEGGGPVEAY